MKNRTRAGCALSALMLLLPVLGIATGLWYVWPFDCADPHEDCGASDSSSGDHTLPQVLDRFAIQAPCGAKGLRYAYNDNWNDSQETLSLHATLTPECLRTFVARVAPGTDLDAAPLLRPDATGFPHRLKFGSFPNGPLTLPDPGHSYRIVTNTGGPGSSDGTGRNHLQVWLSVDTATPSPVVEARFEQVDDDPWR